jgi:hypothetical protein
MPDPPVAVPIVVTVRSRVVLACAGAPGAPNGQFAEHRSTPACRRSLDIHRGIRLAVRYEATLTIARVNRRVDRCPADLITAVTSSYLNMQ